MPGETDLMKFIMLCKARELNPWTGDAHLVGYDGKDGPEFSLITSVQALHKRADRCPEYDGLAAGVIVSIGQQVQELPGTVYPANAVLLGGWARACRKDRAEPYYYSVRLSARDKGRNTWDSDKPGMIRKCAIAGVLR
jgi:phage recombination protein Bet